MSGGFLALLDDIASVMYKTSAAVLKTTSASMNTMASATKMTVHGIAPHNRAAHAPLLTPEREIPVVLRIARNSALNKLWIIPAVVAINLVVPFLLVPVLMLGGTRLCCEGAEKWMAKFSKTPVPEPEPNVAMPVIAPDMTQAQKETALVKSVSTTDKVMSLEWAGFSLQDVAHAPAMQQLAHAGLSGFWMTVGVYGLVAALIKADDIGLHFSQAKGDDPWNRTQRLIGKALLKGTPWVMKNVSNGGTVAMMSVGGDLLVKGVPVAHELSKALSQNVHGLVQNVLPVPFVAGIAAGFTTLAFSTAVGAGVGVGVTLLNRRYGASVKEHFKRAVEPFKSPALMMIARLWMGNAQQGKVPPAEPPSAYTGDLLPPAVPERSKRPAPQ